MTLGVEVGTTPDGEYVTLTPAAADALSSYLWDLEYYSRLVLACRGRPVVDPGLGR